MDVSGEHRIPAPPGRVWQLLNDVHVLRVCIPGCEELERTEGNSYRARVTAKLGAIKASFAGRVILSDIDPPHGYTISGQGQGGAAGFARGSAQVRLTDAGDGSTVLRYQGRADVGGKLASVGSRVLHGAVVQTADHFFTRFSAAVANGGVMPDRHAPDRHGPERHGPAEPTIGVAKQVPPEPTVPYTLGQTPAQQNRILAVGVVIMVFVGLLLFA